MRRFFSSSFSTSLKLFSTLTALALLSPQPSQAQVKNPVRTIEEVARNVPSESVQQLSAARVILADYELLKADFADELRGKNDDEIDRWLIEQTAYVSIPQVASKTTNTKIPVTEKISTAFRPPDYNRALVFKTATGLIDSKGNGSPAPSLSKSGHSNGLATLGEMIREFLYQKLVQKIFDHSHSGDRTVGNYAVIDFGFRVIHMDGSSSQAGSVLRQAHGRSPGYMSMLPPEQVVRIEALLREYGVTTTGTKRNTPYDILNTQGTSDGAVIDFGGFLVFDKPPVRPSVNIAIFGIPDTSVQFFAPGTPSQIIPNADLRIPYGIWGSSVMGVDDSKTDNPFVWSHQLAEDLSRGIAQRIHAEQHVRNMLGPIERIFANHRHRTTCGAIFRPAPAR